MNSEVVAAISERRNEANSSLTAGYVYGHERISQDRGGVGRTYVADGQGSIRALTDNTGNVTDTYFYTAFGEELARTGSAENEFRYTGEQWDANAGFYYNRARWYDPGVGRFTAVDPWGGDPQTPVSLHRYLYGGAGPVSYSDPTGEATMFEEMTAISIQDIVLNAYLVYLLLQGSGGESLPLHETVDNVTYRRERLADRRHVYFPVDMEPAIKNSLFVLAHDEETENGDKYGLLAGGSTSGLDPGMSTRARSLGSHIARNRGGQHAEESIMSDASGRGWKVFSIGVTQPVCTGPEYPGHNCQSLLDQNGVRYNDPILKDLAQTIKDAGHPMAARNRAVGVGLVRLKR